MHRTGVAIAAFEGVVVTFLASNGSEVAASIAIAGDKSKQVVTWGPFAGGVTTETILFAALCCSAFFQLRFDFVGAGAELYSFWLSTDKCGTSGGFVAAGGPAFAGSRDGFCHPRASCEQGCTLAQHAPLKADDTDTKKVDFGVYACCMLDTTEGVPACDPLGAVV